MASYAEVAHHGPPQPDEEVSRNALAVPHPVPEIAHDDSSVHSLNSQGSINIKNPVPSYAEQGKESEEAAARRAEQAKEEAKRAAKKTSDEAERFGKKAENKAAELERDAKSTYSDVKKEASKDYNEAKKEFSKGYDGLKKEAKEVKKQVGTEAEKAKKNAKKAEQWAEDNKSNPVVIGNAVVVTALAGLIGVGAYRKYTAGELTWKVAGTWATVVGLFAVGDYYVSSWLFKNKYPPKN